MRARVVALCAGMLLLLTASSSSADQSRHVVFAKNPFGVLWTWDPPDLEIKSGDTVVWKNPTDAEHHITPFDGPWPADTHLHLEPGGKASLTFKKKGSYWYRCDIQGHSFFYNGMCLGQCGEINVR